MNTWLSKPYCQISHEIEVHVAQKILVGIGFAAIFAWFYFDNVAARYMSLSQVQNEALEEEFF